MPLQEMYLTQKGNAIDWGYELRVKIGVQRFSFGRAD